MTRDVPLIIFLTCIAILIYLYLTDVEAEEEEGQAAHQPGLWPRAEYHE